ncbi:unnamed protein product [Cyprideis torosa]|uniref:Uncharacterized protein n=1 Tax=Cyprideis torosa TaxID=163714 RepID=A0A7R8ZSE8_9CRUS|nr:unnamed protein product [Cyprideis torosa]CAG0905713.1 unnamed protein product [Cyprideis torosa]
MNVFYLLIRLDVWIFRLIQGIVFACVPLPVIKWVIQRELSKSGIALNGRNKWDIQVSNKKFYRRLANDGNLALGETFMKGWWDCEDLVELYARLIKAGPRIPWHIRLRGHMEHIINRQTQQLSKDSAKKLYDLGNDFFASFLDKYMNYTCGYFLNTDDLEEAQINKMNLVARKLKLKPGMKVLDLGCGAGGMAKYLAENFGVIVVGYNLSREQCIHARQLCKGLDVEIIQDDYRNAKGVFDRVICIEMLEHVGPKNYRSYFEVADRCLTSDGIHLIQCMTRLHKQVQKIDRMFLTSWVL